MTAAMLGRLLVIDDEPDIARYIGLVAEELGYEVRVTTDPEVFKRDYDELKPTVIILDVVMPEVDGIELVKFLAQRNCAARVLVISGYAERYLDNTRTLGEAFGLQSITAMAKPVELPKLEEFLKAAR
jgi:DNA-binding NtrC family response regulator